MSCWDMKFRQRVAWLCLLAYLLLTACVIYYMFEISEAFNAYAIDHIHRYHTKDGVVDVDERGFLTRTFSHIADLPKSLVIITAGVIYLQVFMMLIASTKQEPRLYIAYAWPSYLYNKLARSKTDISSSCSVEASNGSNSKLFEKVVVTTPA